MIFIFLLDNEFVHCLVVGSEHTHCSYLFPPPSLQVHLIYLVILPLVGWNHIILLFILCPSFGGAYLAFILLLLYVVIVLLPGLVPVYDFVGLATPCFCSGDYKRMGHARFLNFWT